MNKEDLKTLRELLEQYQQTAMKLIELQRRAGNA